MKLHKQFVILAVLALTATGAASANTISFSSNTGGFASPTWNIPLTFTTFDSTLGILTGVNFDLTGDVNGNINFTNTAADPTDFTSYTRARVTLTLAPSVTAPLGTYIVTPGTATHADGQVAGTPCNAANNAQESCFPFVQGGIVSHPNDKASASGSTGFYGDATTFAFVTTVGAGTYNLNVKAVSLSGIFGGSFSGSADTLAKASGTVTYQYSLAGVPEPGTIALLGGGLLAAGLIRRRRA